MKPDINLDDPRVKKAIEAYQTIMRRALEFSHHIENAVFPIYFPLKSNKPEQIASGVIVRIKTEYFVFSASHVFDAIGTYGLMVSAGVGRGLDVLSGDRFSSARGKCGTHREDPVDSSVFHIQSAVPEELKSASLSFDDLDLSQPDCDHSVYIASGFRTSVSKTRGKRCDAKREALPSAECSKEIYDLMGIDSRTHLTLAYEDQVLVNGNWQTSPRPQGFSGGAIIKISGVSLPPSHTQVTAPKPLLSAITIAQRRETGGKPGVLIGTRIGVHLGLIHKYLPDTLKGLTQFESS